MCFYWALFLQKVIPLLFYYAGIVTSFWVHSFLILFCFPFDVKRHPCASASSSKDMNWDLSQWLPLIENKEFLTWLVKKPTDAEKSRAKQVTQKNIDTIEIIWKTKPGADGISTELDGEENGPVPLPPVLLRYENLLRLFLLGFKF